jgi:hypothetical protein
VRQCSQEPVKTCTHPQENHVTSRRHIHREYRSTGENCCACSQGHCCVQLSPHRAHLWPLHLLITMLLECVKASCHTDVQ